MAVTVVFADRVTLHAEVPAQAPFHPPNVEPAFGVAVRVTAVPLGNVTLHAVPQLIPAGVLVTVPAPVPVVCTLS
jgi:hypothetical protein